jgi:diadenosine tetraphosphate (Ap4A) HIT family hydrolase
MTLYRVAAARSRQQTIKMQYLEENHICVFCPEHVGAHQDSPVELEGEYYYVTRNDYPYAGALAHYLIVSRVHVSGIEQLPLEAGSELSAHIATIKANHPEAVAAAVVLRSGDMNYTASSVEHLHWHLILIGPDIQETIRVKVGCPPE